MDYVIFFLLAGVALFGSLNVVLRKNPVVGALNLVLTILALVVTVQRVRSPSALTKPFEREG